LVLVFFWRLITPDVAARQYYVNGDFTWKEQATDSVTAGSWAAGQLPLWDPYSYAGQPLAADSGAAVFYPMDLAFDMTAGAGGVSLLRMEWRVVVDFMLAAALAYLFFRDLSRSRLAALTATLVYTFGGYLTSYPPHQMDILETGTWLPLALLAVRHVFGDPASTRRQRLRWAMLGGLAMALSFLAGHPQTCLLIVDAAVAYLIFLGLRHRTLRRSWAEAGLAALVAGGLAAIQLVPSLEFFPLSNRTAVSDAAASAGILVRALPNLVVPHYADTAALWLGAGSVVLALAGVWLARKREGWFWFGLAVVALLLGLGGQTPLYGLMEHLGFGLIRDQSRTIFLTSFATAALVALAVASIRARPALQWLLVLAALATCAGDAAPLLLHATGDPLASAVRDAPLWVRGLPMALVLGCLVVATAVGRKAADRSRDLVRHTVVRSLPILALAVLLAVDAMAVNWRNNVTPTPPAPADGLPGTIAFLRSLPGPFRVATDGDQIIPANDLGNYGLATDQGYNDFRVGAIDQLLTSTDYWRVWQILDVHEFLTTRTLSSPYTLQYTEHGVNTYALSYMLPDVWAVWHYQVLPAAGASLSAVLAPAFDPGQQVVLDQAPALAIPNLPQHAQQIQERRVSPERTVVTATVDQPALLVRSVAAYPGWTVTVDGRPAEMLRADHAIQAVAIPAGRHTVVFSFDPWSIKVGMLLTGITASLLLTALLAVPSAAFLQQSRPGKTPAGSPEVPGYSGTSTS
jgi:hypothetical protein